jgi:hypothetical protein
MGLTLALATTLCAGCVEPNTTVHVTVSGDVQGIAQLRIKLDAGGLSTMTFLPNMPDVVSLPTDFNIELDRSRNGELVITVDAFPSDAHVAEPPTSLGTGSADVPALTVGKTNEVAIELTPTPPGNTGTGTDDGGTTDDGGAPGAGADAGDNTGV